MRTTSIIIVSPLINNSPSTPVTLNGGMRMPSWYDILSLEKQDEKEDEAGLKRSSLSLLEYVRAEEASGIPPERIFIGGRI